MTKIIPFDRYASLLSAPKRPDLTDFGGYAAVEAGNFNTINLEAAINIPVTETLAIHASGVRRERDGYRDVDNGLRGDDEYSRGGRLQALFICLVPAIDGAIFSQQWRDALWAKYSTGAPQRLRQSVERYSIVKRA